MIAFAPAGSSRLAWRMFSALFRRATKLKVQVSPVRKVSASSNADLTAGDDHSCTSCTATKTSKVRDHDTVDLALAASQYSAAAATTSRSKSSGRHLEKK